MQYLLSHNTNSYTCTESKGWSAVGIEQRLSFVFTEYNKVFFVDEDTVLRMSICQSVCQWSQLWLLWRAPQIILAHNLELHCPTKTVFLPLFNIAQWQKKSITLCSVFARLVPSPRFWHWRLSQALSQGSKDWHPFHFPAWAAQIKGHILNLCVDTPTVKREGLVGWGRAAALSSQTERERRR